MPVFIALYVLIMSAAGFSICAYDKRAAIAGRGRVSENSLFAVSALGGSAGVYAAMLFFRHKTRRVKFMLFIPLIILLQAAIVIYALKVF